MKAILACALLLVSACTAQASQATATPLAESNAIEVTKQFWRAYMTAQATGDIQPMAVVCERESVAWVNVRGKLLEDEFNGIVSINTSLRMSDFRASTEGKLARVTHRIDRKGYDASASTRRPLEAEQTLPPSKAMVTLERFGTKLLVTEFRLGPWA